VVNRVKDLVQNEIYKMIHQKFIYLSIIFLIFVVVISGIGIEYLLPESSNVSSGYLFVLISSRTAISMIGIILILIFSSMLISYETSSGTLQMMLINPVSRLEFFLAKLITAMIFSILLLITIILTAFLVGKITLGYGDYTERGIVLFTQWQIVSNLLYCYLILLFPIFCLCSYGILISILISDVGFSIGLSVGSIIFLDIVKERLNLTPFLFQSYIETPFELAQDIVEGFGIDWTPKIFYCLGISGAWSVVFLFIAYLIFSKKDYKH